MTILADLLRRLEADEIPITVGFLSGVTRQGRIGVGYSTIYAVDHARGAEPTLTVGDVDRAITAVSEATGAGSAARGKHILGDLPCRANDEQARFVKRLLTGELRQRSSASWSTRWRRRRGPGSTRAPGADALRRYHAQGRGRSGRGRGRASRHRLRAVPADRELRREPYRPHPDPDGSDASWPPARPGPGA